ncbi:MAG: hypothetical protein K6F93_05070, partial [Lachnospiraceae bacterium]|nr:hypothetical protein [Lachnospiraceae bacterium]
MEKVKIHGLWSKLSKFMALTLAFVMVAGVLPASAASKEVVCKTKKKLVKAMEDPSITTIIFRTDR